MSETEPRSKVGKAADIETVGKRYARAVTARRGRIEPVSTTSPDKMIDLSSCRWTALVPVILGMLAAGCGSRQPSIEFTKIPSAAEGTPFKKDPIEGRVIRAKPGQQIVLYAKSSVWWVQPFTTQPFTPIRPDSTWQNISHPGTEYAALLVEPGYAPAPTIRELPRTGGPVVAVAVVPGTGPAPVIPPPKTIHFSGYDWELRRQPSQRGGRPVPYDPQNASVDAKGFLHLRTSEDAGKWLGAEVRLTQSLGQGLYKFTVRDVSHFEPAEALSMFTWDELAGEQHHREVDIEIGRWGDPSSKNGQYVVQPAEEPANMVRFEVPAGPLTYSFRWEPGKISFQTVRGSATIAAHEFTSGVPSPGGESVNISMYVSGGSPIPPRKSNEVIVEKFEFLP
jgi:hypothetical protein